MRASSPPEAALARVAAGRPGFSAQQERDVVAGVVVSHGDRDLRLGQRELARRACTAAARAPAWLRRRSPTTAAARATAVEPPSAPPPPPPPARRGHRGRAVVRQLVPHREQGGEARARVVGVPTPQLRQLGPAGLHRRQPLRVAVDRLRGRRAGRARRHPAPPQRTAAAPRRARTGPARRAPRGPSRPGRVRPRSVAEGDVRGPGGRAMGVGIGEEGLLGGEPLVLAHRR